MTQTYTAINIGPIVSTIQMARKPRELWSASYLFSHLMKCIIEELLKTINKDDIISPATFDPNEKNGVGLYPDRVFLKNVSMEDLHGKIAEAQKTFWEATKFKDKNGNTIYLDMSYFNIMLVSDNCEKDSEAIDKLNKKLDCLELFNRSVTDDAEQKVRQRIGKDHNWLFMNLAFKEDEDKPKGTLAEFATAELKEKFSQQWNEFQNEIQKDNDKDAFKKFPKDALKSYHKYICVVQADGDNVGKTVSHKDLPNGEVNKISKELLEFGKNAKKAIDDFGGLPIYAGGDDLLFIAPVVGKEMIPVKDEKGNELKNESGKVIMRPKNIFDLLNTLNDDSFGEVRKVIGDCKLKTDEREIHASLSFGVSINYYKYPLYEALENARHLLFDVAKHVDGKNAVAIDWRKHSGGAFSFSFSKNKPKLKDAFEKMIAASAVKESIVSAVAHKIRENEGLLELWFKENDAADRNLNFFKKYMDYDPDKKNKCNDDNYKESAMNLLTEIFKIENKDISKAVRTMYGMLRTAKFINGEEVKDE